MKATHLGKLTIAGALMAACAGPAAAAGGWVLAADSYEGNTRFLIDVQRFDYSVNKHGTHVFFAPMRMVGDSGTHEGYVAIDAEGCLGAGGDMVLAVGKSTSRYWWALNGTRVYDKVGESVCAVAAAVIEQAQTDRETSAAPVPARPGRI
jgi:hypothetical protein